MRKQLQQILITDGLQWMNILHFTIYLPLTLALTLTVSGKGLCFTSLSADAMTFNRLKKKALTDAFNFFIIS